MSFEKWRICCSSPGIRATFCKVTQCPASPCRETAAGAQLFYLGSHKKNSCFILKSLIWKCWPESSGSGHTWREKKKSILEHFFIVFDFGKSNLNTLSRCGIRTHPSQEIFAFLNQRQKSSASLMPHIKYMYTHRGRRIWERELLVFCWN